MALRSREPLTTTLPPASLTHPAQKAAAAWLPHAGVGEEAEERPTWPPHPSSRAKIEEVSETVVLRRTQNSGLSLLEQIPRLFTCEVACVYTRRLFSVAQEMLPVKYVQIEVIPKRINRDRGKRKIAVYRGF